MDFSPSMWGAYPSQGIQKLLRGWQGKGQQEAAVTAGDTAGAVPEFPLQPAQDTVGSPASTQETAGLPKASKKEWGGGRRLPEHQWGVGMESRLDKEVHAHIQGCLGTDSPCQSLRGSREGLKLLLLTAFSA